MDGDLGILGALLVLSNSAAPLNTTITLCTGRKIKIKQFCQILLLSRQEGANSVRYLRGWGRVPWALPAG